MGESGLEVVSRGHGHPPLRGGLVVAGQIRERRAVPRRLASGARRACGGAPGVIRAFVRRGNPSVAERSMYVVGMECLSTVGVHMRLCEPVIRIPTCLPFMLHTVLGCGIPY